MLRQWTEAVCVDYDYTETGGNDMDGFRGRLLHNRVLALMFQILCYSIATSEESRIEYMVCIC